MLKTPQIMKSDDKQDAHGVNVDIDDAVDWQQIAHRAQAENERLREALEECAKATWFDDMELEFRPTREAIVARKALRR